MDIVNSLKRYILLKNKFIPEADEDIGSLRVKIVMEEAVLGLIKDEKVFLEDYKWEIRTRGFTIFNLIHLPSLITLLVFLLVVASAAVLGVIVETLIRTFIFFQDYEFEDRLYSNKSS